MITFYWSGGTTRNAVMKAVDNRIAEKINLVQVVSFSKRPTAADLVVTTAGINARNSMYAGNLGAPAPVVLPEAAGFLADQISAAHAAGKNLVLVAADVEAVTLK